MLALLSAFERARRGAGGLVLVSGYSGVGKSSLMSEIHKPIAGRGGYFVQGKFDQINRDVPLAPMARAFREIIRQILTEPAGALAAWKQELCEAVGANGRLLVELIPELELLLGPQPEVPTLGPSESANRFALLVQRFLRVFAAAGHPLALFLDDLQWINPSSLKLLVVLLGDPDLCHLFAIGAYRDNEVDAAHPLPAALDELRKEGASITELTLKPLDLAMVTQIVADTLSARAREAERPSARGGAPLRAGLREDAGQPVLPEPVPLRAPRGARALAGRGARGVGLGPRARPGVRGHPSPADAQRASTSALTGGATGSPGSSRARGRPARRFSVSTSGSRPRSPSARGSSGASSGSSARPMSACRSSSRNASTSSGSGPRFKSR